MTYSKLVPAAIKALGAGLLVCYSAPLTLTFFREPYDWDDWNYMYGHPATIGNGVALEIQLAHIFFSVGIYLLASPVGVLIEYLSTRSKDRRK